MNRKDLAQGSLALLLALAGTAAHAELVNVDVPDPLVALTTPAHTAGDWMPATASASASQDGRAFALAYEPEVDGVLQATAKSIGSRTMPTSSTVNLWTFITSMRAQQQGNRFVILETHMSLLQLAETSPAAVPLPGALWLMVMGLLGFAGIRVTGQGVPSADRQPATGRLLLPAM